MAVSVSAAGITAASIYGVTNRVAGQQISWQVGNIGGYASFIGYDEARSNAIVVLQNAFNWSNDSGIALLADLATQDRVVGQ